MNNVLARQRLPAEPRLVAVASGAGGVGRSTFVCDLARLMVRRGKRVLIVDADLASPGMHLRFDVAEELLPRGEILRDEDQLDRVIVQGDRTRPAILPLGLVRARTFARFDLSASRLAAGLRAQRYDEILIDLPAAPDPVWTSLFVLSDVPILMCSTEAMSLHGAIAYARAALVYAVLAHPDAELAGFEVLRAVESLRPDATITEIRSALAAPRSSELLDSVVERLQTYLVLSQTREPAERELGHAIALAMSHTLDVWPRYLGAFDHDERRWFHLRHEQRGGLGTETAAEGTCDEILKRLGDIEAIDRDNPRVARAAAAQPWQKLGVSPELDPVALRQAYRRLWEGFRRESPLTTAVVRQAARERIIRELEDANRELQASMAESAAVPRVTVKAAPVRPANPGERLRNARNEKGLSQRELSLQTKIGLQVLESIERFEVDDLPRPVYLRGYLREVAHVLGLDPNSVMDEYLTAVSEARNARILTRSTPSGSRS